MNAEYKEEQQYEILRFCTFYLLQVKIKVQNSFCFVFFLSKYFQMVDIDLKNNPCRM